MIVWSVVVRQQAHHQARRLRHGLPRVLGDGARAHQVELRPDRRVEPDLRVRSEITAIFSQSLDGKVDDFRENVAGKLKRIIRLRPDCSTIQLLQAGSPNGSVAGF
jgi:hypothetical protein